MPPFNARMTTELFWSAAVVVATVDIGLILLARWRKTPRQTVVARLTRSC